MATRRGVGTFRRAHPAWPELLLRAVRCMTRRRQVHGNIRGRLQREQGLVLASRFCGGVSGDGGKPARGRASGKQAGARRAVMYCSWGSTSDVSSIGEASWSSHRANII
jgi:hypothetical protein